MDDLILFYNYYNFIPLKINKSKINGVKIFWNRKFLIGKLLESKKK